MKLVDKIKNKSVFFKSVLKVGSGNLIGQSISVITVPILSRIYDSIAYADYALLTSTATIVINIATLGLTSAIMNPEKEEEAKKILTTESLLTVLAATVFAVGCYAIQDMYAVIDVSGSYIIALLLAWIYIAVTNMQLMVGVYINKQGKYNKLLVNPIIGAVANVIIAIPLGLLGFGYQGFVITSVSSNLIMIVHMIWKNWPFYKGYTLSDAVYVIKTYKDYVLFQYPANFISNVATEYPTQFLGRTFSTVSLADYSMCLRVLKYPIRLIATPISTVYFRTATEMHRDGNNLGEFTYKMIKKILFVSFFPVVICVIVAEPVFGFVLGDSWSAVGTVASVLAAQYAMMFCSQCVSYCRVAIGKQASNLLYGTVWLVFIAVACALGFKISHSIMGTILAFSIAQSVIYILDMGLNFYYINKKMLTKYMSLACMYSIGIYAAVFIKMAIIGFDF